MCVKNDGGDDDVWRWYCDMLYDHPSKPSVSWFRNTTENLKFWKRAVENFSEGIGIAHDVIIPIAYLHSDHIYKGEVLRMLYSIFLLDLQNAQHHDIPFYAIQLHISPVYLSRKVRQVTGRTFIDYINQMLLMEAPFLLQTSPMSITQTADHLRFADAPSFSKFFLRMKGINPRRYRMEK
jgi:AraC-like DNA-binding protein